MTISSTLLALSFSLQTCFQFIFTSVSINRVNTIVNINRVNTIVNFGFALYQWYLYVNLSLIGLTSLINVEYRVHVDLIGMINNYLLIIIVLCCSRLY